MARSATVVRNSAIPLLRLALLRRELCSSTGPAAGGTQIREGHFERGVDGAFDIAAVAGYRGPLERQATGPWPHGVVRGQPLAAEVAELRRQDPRSRERVGRARPG